MSDDPIIIPESTQPQKSDNNLPFYGAAVLIGLGILFVLFRFVDPVTLVTDCDGEDCDSIEPAREPMTYANEDTGGFLRLPPEEPDYVKKRKKPKSKQNSSSSPTAPKNSTTNSSSDTKDVAVSSSDSNSTKKDEYSESSSSSNAQQQQSTVKEKEDQDAIDKKWIKDTYYQTCYAENNRNLCVRYRIKYRCNDRHMDRNLRKACKYKHKAYLDEIK